MKQELVEKLIANRDELFNAVADATEAQINTIRVCGKWTIKDTVGHISYWEQVIHDMVRESYAEGRPHPMKDDPKDDGINPREAAKRKDWSWQRVRAEFENTRRATIERVESLSELDLEFQVPSPWWNDNRIYPVGTLIEEDTVGHCREHLEQIKRWKLDVS